MRGCECESVHVYVCVRARMHARVRACEGSPAQCRSVCTHLRIMQVALLLRARAIADLLNTAGR